MSNTIAFFFPPYPGHLNKTLQLALHYANNGSKVCYFIFGRNPQVAIKHENVEVVPMVSRPWGTGYDEFKPNDTKTGAVAMSDEDIALRDPVYKAYLKRKSELEQILTQYNPDLIFVDELLVNDFLICYPYLQNRKFVVLTPFFPSFPNDHIPPLSEYSFPNGNAFKEWETHTQKLQAKLAQKKEDRQGNDAWSVVQRVFKEQKIPDNYAPEMVWKKLPYYKNVEKWHFQPVELDFEPYPLRYHEKYMGPMVAMNRIEDFTPAYNLFLKIATLKPTNKIIFCSFGTVIETLVKDEANLKAFYSNLVQIAKQKTDWFFLVKIPDQYLELFRPQSVNCMFINYVPQLDILKKADVFISHCGGNSCLESIFMETPVLCVPPSDTWDYNGIAARMVYHQLGLKADLTDKSEFIVAQIEKLMVDTTFKNKTSIMGKMFREKYADNYIENLLDALQ